MRILIIEDDVTIQKLIYKRLSEESYAVDFCSDGENGLAYALGTQYDCILLDLMLPKMNGIEILKALRAKHCTSYVLIMTAKDAIEDRVRGLDAGADDYIVKPFSLDELSARIRALIRRKQEVKHTTLTLADLEMNIATHTVKRNNEIVYLSSKEYALLHYLISHQGQVLTRTQIADHVWDYNFYSDSNIVDVYIRYLRNKIDKPYKTKLIHTIRGFGYVMRIQDENEKS